MKNRLSAKLSILFLVVFLFGFTSENKVKQDPLEPMNRKIYKFNKAIDAMYIKPISITYSKVFPKPIKRSVGNFISNVGEVPNSINHILQGKFKNATSNFMRLLINSTFGVCGIFDVATHMGFEKKQTDFGQTLARMGYKQSRYIVLPILGPSTVRDGVGLVGNNFASVPYYLKPKWRNRYLATQTVHKRAELQEDVADVMNTAGVDEYALVRDAYLQRRQYLNNDGVVSAEDELLKGPPE
jgi:phospholipid-binding lipoprotein MlaA